MKLAVALVAISNLQSAYAAPRDWEFDQSGAICTAELAASNAPATITFLKDATDSGSIYVKLANPAWSATPASDRELLIRYTMLPYRDEHGTLRPAIHVDLPATAIIARSMVENTGGRKHGALGFILTRRTFDEFADNARVGLRIAIYIKEQSLTDWVKIDDCVRRSLDRCTDALAK